MTTVTVTLDPTQVQSVLDQDGTVTALQAQVAQLNSDKAGLQASLDAANARIAAAKADAAKITTDLG